MEALFKGISNLDYYQGLKNIIVEENSAELKQSYRSIPFYNDETVNRRIGKIIDEINNGNADICKNLLSSTTFTIWKNKDKIRGMLNPTISKLKQIWKLVNKEVDLASVA